MDNCTTLLDSQGKQTERQMKTLWERNGQVNYVVAHIELHTALKELVFSCYRASTENEVYLNKKATFFMVMSKMLLWKVHNTCVIKTITFSNLLTRWMILMPYPNFNSNCYV